MSNFRINFRINFSFKRCAAALALLFSSMAAQGQVYTLASALDEIQGLYLGYYGRPGDPGGQLYWAERLVAEQNLASVLAAFGSSPEFVERFGGLSNKQLVNRLFEQILGRPADPEGEAFYVGLLDSNAVTLAFIAKSLIDGIQGESDMQAFAAKVAAGNHFSSLVAELQAMNPGDDFAPAVYSRASSNIDSVEARNAYHEKLLAEGYCVGQDGSVIDVGMFQYINPFGATALYLDTAVCSFDGMYREGGTSDASDDAIYGDAGNYEVVEVTYGDPIVTSSRCDGDSRVYEVFNGATRLYPVESTRENGTLSFIPTTSKLKFIEMCLDGAGNPMAFHVLVESKILGLASIRGDSSPAPEEPPERPQDPPEEPPEEPEDDECEDEIDCETD